MNALTSNDLNIEFHYSSRRGILARIPPLIRNSSQKVKTLYDSSFAVSGPKLWNLIPKSVKECVSLTVFKSSLDHFHKDFPDRPPVAGYIVQNDNSLLDWSNTRTLP